LDKRVDLQFALVYHVCDREIESIGMRTSSDGMGRCGVDGGLAEGKFSRSTAAARVNLES